MTLFHNRQLRVQNVADEFGIHAVDNHAQAVAEERVLNVFDAAFQGKDTFAARQLRQFDESFNQFAFTLLRAALNQELEESRHLRDLLHCEGVEYAGDRPADDDKERGGVI